jgi:hypothetical protein
MADESHKVETKWVQHLVEFGAMPRSEQAHFRLVKEELQGSMKRDEYAAYSDRIMWVLAREYRLSHEVTATSAAVQHIHSGRYSIEQDGKTLIAAMKGPVGEEAFNALARLMAAAGLGFRYPHQQDAGPL